MKVRDTQRSAVYLAEGVLDQHERSTYQTAAKVKRRIETILRSPWARSRFVVHPHAVQLSTPDRARRASYDGAAKFTLPRWSWREAVVLHELAHLLESRRSEDHVKVNPSYSWSVRIDVTAHAAHGWRFGQTYLELVERFMGAAAASDLRRSFALHRVRCSPPTPDQPSAMHRHAHPAT